MFSKSSFKFSLQNSFFRKILSKQLNQSNIYCQRLSFSTQQDSSAQEEEANFGYQKVNINDKQEKVNNVFHSVAQKYDLMNDVLSLGIHRCWKETFVNDIGIIRPSKVYQENNVILEKPAQVLDVAGGTGDIAFKIFDKHKEESSHLNRNSNLKITCLDINVSMIEEGKQRSSQLGINPKQIEFVVGDAENLSQFEDNTFDLYTISFGLRNVPRIPLALKEAHRVLKKGGRIMILEFSKVHEVLDPFYKFYTLNVMPVLGQLVANDSESYRYLGESIDKFYDQESLLRLMQDSGFEFCNYKNLNMGIVAIHSGFKLE